MCGGDYPWWGSPRQLERIDGESTAERAIRLLKENGISEADIYITSSAQWAKEFAKYGVVIIQHENDYTGLNGKWPDAFPESVLPCCYLMGDVWFSEKAIQTIVKYKRDDTKLPAMFFGSAPPFPAEYAKSWAEPFAFKVWDQSLFRHSIKETYRLREIGHYKRDPIAWELWETISGEDPLPMTAENANYVVINDITCDIDGRDDMEKLRRICRAMKEARDDERGED